MRPSRSTIAWMTSGLVLGSAATFVVVSATDLANSCPMNAEPMMRIELAFGLGRASGPEISEEIWRAFLDTEVTPRFPDGLTVLSGAGQWRGKSGAITKESSRLLLIWALPGRDTNRRIEELRGVWKRQHAQESVLRAESRDCVSF